MEVLGFANDRFIGPVQCGSEPTMDGPKLCGGTSMFRADPYRTALNRPPSISSPRGRGWGRERAPSFESPPRFPFRTRFPSGCKNLWGLRSAEGPPRGRGGGAMGGPPGAPSPSRSPAAGEILLLASAALAPAGSTVLGL